MFKMHGLGVDPVEGSSRRPGIILNQSARSPIAMYDALLALVASSGLGPAPRSALNMKSIPYSY